MLYRFNKIFIRFFGFLIRDFEEFRLTGATYVMLSAFLILLFFDQYICIASILIMSYADTAAAIVGKKYGKTNNNISGRIHMNSLPI